MRCYRRGSGVLPTITGPCLNGSLMTFLPLFVTHLSLILTYLTFGLPLSVWLIGRALAEGGGKH